VTEPPAVTDDERRLAELGYKQELTRSWSGFSNFAISFSIISILAGCFTTFGQAWNNGGPIAVSWGWPVIAGFILIIGLCMSEMLSAMPTAGGIYWWAARLGGPMAGFYTGWLNLIGLLAVTASVVYGCATFLSATIGLFRPSWEGSLTQVFLLFVGLMLVVSLLNIFSSHLLAVVNNVSAYWHVLGAAAVVLILVLVPDDHQDASFIFTERLNNSGFNGGESNGLTFWFYVLPLGFLLTQYTITGFDASAHLSEETHGAANAAAAGLWKSIFYSAIGGWVLLLSFLYAVQDPAEVTAAGGFVGSIFDSALSPGFNKVVFLITTSGQLFCGIACMTSCSRMIWGFSRDGGIPGGEFWTKLSSARVPVNAVIGSAVIAVLITLPALVEVKVGEAIVPVAFYAVVSVAVIGLYLAFLVPIWLRLRAGDDFEVGPWNLGRHYKWMCWAACIEIVIVAIYFVLPFVPAAAPWNDEFEWKFVNYAPILTGAALLAITVWWFTSARKWFTGPRRTLEGEATPAPVV
jgi:amino acid transporter